MVFLHYFGGSSASWQWVAEALSDDYRCIALNLPGFGGTTALPEPTIKEMAEEVLLTLAQLGISSYTLIGHSMGGKIAVQVAAAANAGAVKQLILLAPSPPTIERMPAAEKQRMLRHPNAAVAEKTVQQATIASLTTQQHTLAVDTQLCIDENTWRWWLLQGMNHSIEDQVPLINFPITVLASKDDPAITFEMIQQDVMPVLTTANLITTADLGHLLPLEAPAWVAGQIRAAVAA